jgi:invasion protein IalB
MKEVPVVAYLSRVLSIAASSAILLIGSQVLAKGAALLPGGAQTLREGYGDWVVSCDIRTQNNASQKVCGLSQVQTNTQSHQRILFIQLQPKGSVVDGTLVLPFGPDLSKGVTLQVDDGSVFASLPFWTCLPAGCLVKLSFDTKSVAALRAGHSLKVNVFPVGLPETSFSVSLKGFPNALDRTIVLLK